MEEYRTREDQNAEKYRVKWSGKRNLNNAYLFHQWEKGLFDASRLYLDIVQLVQSQRIGHDGSFRRNFDKNNSKGLLLSTHSESETWVSKGVEQNTRGDASKVLK